LLHHEAENISSRVAAETIENLLFRANGKRRRFFFKTTLSPTMSTILAVFLIRLMVSSGIIPAKCVLRIVDLHCNSLTTQPQRPKLELPKRIGNASAKKCGQHTAYGPTRTSPKFKIFYSIYSFWICQSLIFHHM
jgi:hypothetical protein